MTGRERVLRTLAFSQADRTPTDLWMLPAARLRHGAALDALLAKYPRDIASVASTMDMGTQPLYYQPGSFTDPWGSRWQNMQAGVIGEVKQPVFADYAALNGYVSPLRQFLQQWKQDEPALKNRIAQHRKEGKFVIGGWISIFERLQFLRGTEELYCDLALEEPGMFAMLDIVMEYIDAYLSCWLTQDIDAVAFGDDWGTQISLLVSPECWRRIFRPLYRRCFDRIHQAGKKVFFHSDGYIFQLYPDFIEMGVDAINSQLFCMGVEKVAQFAGKITFWGEISRQNILPYGTPQDVRQAAQKMKQLLQVGGGGLIGQSEIGADVPLQNVEALLDAWN